MPWYVYVARFFAGAFLANAVPHFISGVQGRRFPTPFASPPGKGESSPTLNVLWSAANAGVGYALLHQVGSFGIMQGKETLTVGVGGLVMSLLLSRAFGQVYGSTAGTSRTQKL